MENNTRELDEKAESLCRWGAARGGAIVVLPGLGAVALIVNEIYMIMRIGTVYGEKIESSAIKSFIMALGGAFAGQSLATLIPFPPLQIPIAVSVTYGIGKAAQAWVKDGMPKDCSKYKAEVEKARKFAKEHLQEFKSDQRKDEPLGDESKEI